MLPENIFYTLVYHNLDSTFMQNSSISLPNRSHSVTEMATKNDEQHQNRVGLMHSNSITNNSGLYQRSSSYMKTINDGNNNPNFESSIHHDDLYRTDKYNIVNIFVLFYLNSFYWKPFFFVWML